MKRHQAPWECSFGKEDKNECQPGNRPKSDREYLEIMSLCVLQAGLGWAMIRKIWPRVKGSFHRFNINILANKKLGDILKNPHTIKNPKKIEAIIKNAQKFKMVKQKYGSFAQYLGTLKPLSERKVIATLSSEFNHFGKYSAEYFLHSVGYWK